MLLKRWLETFARLGACVNPDGSPYKMTKTEMQRLHATSPYSMVDLIELHSFHPANDERPFGFVPETFEKRKQTHQSRNIPSCDRRGIGWAKVY
jgi:hypothetical protein